MKARIQLDWSRLLGFDQVGEARRVGDSRLTKAGVKNMGDAARVGDRINAKIGSKPGMKPAEKR